MSSTVAVIGAGTIGRSFAYRFARSGYTVRVFDPRSDLAEVVAELQAEVRSSHPTGTVVAPGDLERDRAAADDGVELAASTAEQLRALARTHDLPFPDPLTEGTSR